MSFPWIALDLYTRVTRRQNVQKKLKEDSHNQNRSDKILPTTFFYKRSNIQNETKKKQIMEEKKSLKHRYNLLTPHTPVER